MSLEFADKVLGVRKFLGLNQNDFADLLGITPALVNMWERLHAEETSCWERVIQFLIDCPSSALEFLRQKPWANEGGAWPDRITQLREMLGWSMVDLADFLGIHEGSLHPWMNGENIAICYQITMSALEVYSSVDPKEWPSALHFEAPDVISEERIRLLRLSLGKTLAQLGNILHVTGQAVGRWERGVVYPVWSANLLLRMLETWPRSVELLERIPWDDRIITPEVAFRIRTSLGLTGLEMAHLLGASKELIHSIYEVAGIAGKRTGSAILVYRLLEEYPEEFLSYVQSLSDPSGQACSVL